MKMIEKIVISLADRGISQRAFAAMVGLSENRISKWKDGTGEPTARQALAMARLLGLPVEYLIDDDQETLPAATPPSEAERRIWEAVRTLGPDEAWRRLLLPPDDGRRTLKPIGGASLPPKGSSDDPAGKNETLAANE